MSEAVASNQNQPPKPIQGYLDRLSIGRKQSYRNLELYPLIADGAGPAEYLLLDQALHQDLIRITEVDRSGSVPELKLKNKSDRRVLILDGEELVGAKQNRIVNTTILIAGQACTVIPVSCVEQGRWSYDSETFGSKQRKMYAAARAEKAHQVASCLRTAGSFASNQSAVWDEIGSRIRSRGACSESGAMSCIYEKEESSLGDYSRRFRPLDNQVGAVFAINGRVAGMECFSRPDTLQAVFDKLVRSYALDAIDWYESGNNGEASPAGGEGAGRRHARISSAHARHLLDAARKARVETRPSVSLGEDHRLQGKDVAGFALTHEGELLHLSVFAGARDRGNAEGHGEPGPDGRQSLRSSWIQRFSRRKRSR